MEEKKSLKIGTQEIQLDTIRTLDLEELTKLLETIYFDGYQEGVQKGIVKQEQENTVTKTTTTASSQIIEAKEEINKIEITIHKESKDPLDKKMQEIGALVYQFKNPGFVLYRLNGVEEEYLKNKYNFTTLPMKALVFNTQEEAEEHKEQYWGGGYDELQIRKAYWQF